MNRKLNSSETILVGAWIAQAGQVVADDVSKRIEYLTQNVLKEVASSDDGWELLYRDIDDSRYWELIHPDNDSHGAGAPTLKCLSQQEAEKKYHI
ncbi:MAG: hypothetical protein K0U59_08600 [Gammaproteobacteria bacterium]|nr:hypothetical protein [Gammaproteobacteria bacterium]